MRSSAWYNIEIRSCTPPLTTSSIEERWRRVRRGGSAILQRVVRRTIFLPSACACKYRAIYFVITCRDTSRTRDHAIGVSARSKITAAWKIYSRARIRYFPLFAVTCPFISRQRDIIRVQLYFFQANENNHLYNFVLCGRVQSAYGLY